jgi:hypothetical protein
LRFQHDTALYRLPHLISWDWTSPYEPCALYESLMYEKTCT